MPNCKTHTDESFVSEERIYVDYSCTHPSCGVITRPLHEDKGAKGITRPIRDCPKGDHRGNRTEYTKQVVYCPKCRKDGA